MVYLLCAKIVLCGDDRVANKVFSSSEKHTLQLGMSIWREHFACNIASLPAILKMSQQVIRDKAQGL